MEFNDVGRIVEQCWNAIPEHHPNVRIAEVQFMPDHVHAIMVLGGNGSEEKDPSKSTQWVDGTGAEEKLGGEAQRAETRLVGCDHGGVQIGEHQAHQCFAGYTRQAILEEGL